MSLKNPFTARSVVKTGDYRLQITLPSDDLDDADIDTGDFLAVLWDPSSGELEIILRPLPNERSVRDRFGPRAFPTRLVSVGASRGLTIPAEVRNFHGLASDDDLLLQGQEDRWFIDLSL